MHSFLLSSTLAVVLIWSIGFSLTTVVQNHHLGTRFVVEYDSSDQGRIKNQTIVFRKLLENRLQEQNVSFHDLKILDDVPDLFSGFSISVKNSRGEKALRAASFVKAIYPVQSVSRPIFPQTPRVLNTLVAGKIEDVFQPHVQVEIPRLHAEGHKCRGINIAVIDTGCDCRHPALGNGFGKGYKLAMGYDFVGNAFNGTNAPKPDNSPCTPCALHGTHIMGVISAGENHMGFRGVCPEATMFSYRVFGCEGGTTDELIAAALLRAYKDGAEIFSLSVGAPGGWSGGSIASVVASRIAQKRVVIVASGNTGLEGMFFTTSPATGIGVLSVGSVQSTALVSYPFTTTVTGSFAFHYFSTFQMAAGTYPVYPIRGKGLTKNDACERLPSTTPNLSKYAVLVRRSETNGCTLPNQLENLAKKGAKQIIWVNNDTFPEYFPPDSTNGIFVGVVTRDVGRLLRIQYLQSLARLNITILNDQTITQVVSPDSGKVSSFSTYGPMFDLVNPQPGVMGVGGNVLSTYPVSSGSYAIASGTSVSAPQLAGIAAHILSVHGKATPPQEVYSRLASSALPVSNYSETKILESVCHQGTGLVNAWCAVMSTTVVSPFSLSLNDTIHLNGTQSVFITNKGRNAIPYLVKHVPAGTAVTFSNTNTVNPWPVPLINASASLTFSVDRFVVNPGETVKVIIRFQPPPDLDPLALPVYSGFIRFKSEAECESHTVSYYGVGAPMKKRPVLDYGLSYGDNYTLPALDSGLTGTAVKERHTFSLEGLDFPLIEYRMAFGSPLLLFHLVSGSTTDDQFHLSSPQGVGSLSTNSTLNPTTGNRSLTRRDGEGDRGGLKLLNLQEPADDFPGRLANTFRGIRLIGSLKAYDSLSRWNPRQTLAEGSSVDFNGEVFDLSTPDYQHAKPRKVPDGEYRILVRALRVTGSPRREQDFEAWLSPHFFIRRKKDHP